jgi:hypothetical protein
MQRRNNQQSLAHLSHGHEYLIDYHYYKERLNIIAQKREKVNMMKLEDYIVMKVDP